MAMDKTRTEGLTLYHDVPCLGAGVAKGVVDMTRRYVELTSLDDLPPITLSGKQFANPWSEIVGIEGCSGNAGPSEEALKQGDTYECLFLMLPDSSSPRTEAHPTTIEGVTAHEITHLRWHNLRHGPEFNARVIALLHGAKFPKRGGWSAATHQKVREARKEASDWIQNLLKPKSRGGENISE